MSDRDVDEPTCIECGNPDPDSDGLCPDCREAGEPLEGGDDDDLPPDPEEDQ